MTMPAGLMGVNGSGAGVLPPPPPPFASSVTPEQVWGYVNEQELRTQELRSRWEDDYQLYLLKEPAAEDGYERHVTNEPMTFADKIMAYLSTAKVLIRFPVESKQAAQRQREDVKERFILGALRAADTLLAALVLPSLRDQLGAYITLRGSYGGRVLMQIEQDGSTSIEVMPWDPLHTFYSVGRRGIEWACYRMTRMKEDVRAEYGVEPVAGGLGVDGREIEIFDYYDREMNAVCTRTEWLKPPTPHGFRFAPVFLGVVGPLPPLRGDLETLTLESYGESVFKANREAYRNFNATMSDMRTLVRRSVKQGLKVFSQDGKKTLDQDPYREGSVVSLRTGSEQVEPLGLLEMAKETAGFLGQVSGEVQRGSLPHTVYGELQFQLSGFAINTLRQGIDSALAPRRLALQRAYRDIASLLVREMATGQFASVSLSGYGYAGDYFEGAFGSQDMQGRDSPEVDVVVSLPQDEPAKYAIAKIAREGPKPLLPDRIILDQILGMQNVDAIQDVVLEERGATLSPVAALVSLITALDNQGRGDLAEIYLADLQRLLMAQQQGMAGPGAPPPGAGAPPPGFTPSVAPNAMLGRGPPAPLPQGTLPLVPPGSARPGAMPPQAGEAGLRDRLARVGLELGR